MKATYYFVYNDQRYPSCGMGDWQGPLTFENDDEAIAEFMETVRKWNHFNFLMKVDNNIISEIYYIRN